MENNIVDFEIRNLIFLVIVVLYLYIIWKYKINWGRLVLNKVLLNVLLFICMWR